MPDVTECVEKLLEFSTGQDSISSWASCRLRVPGSPQELTLQETLRLGDLGWEGDNKETDLPSPRPCPFEEVEWSERLVKGERMMEFGLSSGNDRRQDK